MPGRSRIAVRLNCALPCSSSSTSFSSVSAIPGSSSIPISLAPAASTSRSVGTHETLGDPARAQARHRRHRAVPSWPSPHPAPRYPSGRDRRRLSPTPHSLRQPIGCSSPTKRRRRQRSAPLHQPAAAPLASMRDRRSRLKHEQVLSRAARDEARQLAIDGVALQFVGRSRVVLIIAEQQHFMQCRRDIFQHAAKGRYQQHVPIERSIQQAGGRAARLGRLAAWRRATNQREQRGPQPGRLDGCAPGTPAHQELSKPVEQRFEFRRGFAVRGPEALEHAAQRLQCGFLDFQTGPRIVNPPVSDQFVFEEFIVAVVDDGVENHPAYRQLLHARPAQCRRRSSLRRNSGVSRQAGPRSQYHRADRRHRKIGSNARRPSTGRQKRRHSRGC